jgi:dethiobiotin synthetase
MTGPIPVKRANTPRRSRTTRAIEEAPAPPSNPPTTLIVGTDTSVGKTWVTCALARALRDLGQKVVAVKPFETGCEEPPSEREDGYRLAQAAGQTGPKRALVRLPGELAPPVAAEQAGITLDYDDVVARMRSLTAPDSLLLVESAGGVLSPLTWEDNALDLAHSLDARVIVVAADRLGTISQTLLTLRVLQGEKIPILGVVLKQPSTPDESSRTNAMALARLAPTTTIVSVPHLADPTPAAEAVKEVVGWILP